METFTIETEGLDLKIAAVNMTSVHIHEETIDEVVQELAADLRRSGVLRHPVIVDEKTIVVLDGMHRVASLKQIGCVRIPVCLVDYDNPSIRVGTWYRTISNGDNGGFMKEVTRCNIRTTELNIQEAIKHLEAGTAAAFVATRHRCLVIESRVHDVMHNFQVVASVEQVARRLGFKIGYETETDALTKLENGETQLVVGPPPITKQDVRRFALRGDLFPHKATRHVIPARPLGIDVPISLLQDRGLSLEQVNKQLIEILRKKTLEKLEPGSLVENRRYEEQVFLFK